MSTHESNKSRGARSVQRILDAAARLFGKEGFEGATMLAVARAAGVSKGLLHYHFRSKEHLLIEAQRATLRQIHLRFEERFSRGEHGLPTALDALDALFGAFKEMHSWAPFMLEILSLATQQDEVREQVTGFYEEANTLLERGIELAFADDKDKLTIPPARLMALVRTAFHGVIVEMAQARTPEDLAAIDVVYKDMRALFERALLSGTDAMRELDQHDIA